MRKEMSKKVAKEKSLGVNAPSRKLGILSVIFGVLSLLPFLGTVFALASITFGILYIRKTGKKTLGTIGIIIGVAGLLYSVYALAMFLQVTHGSSSKINPDSIKPQQEELERYFPESYSIGLNRTNFETYYDGVVELPFNGTKKQFNIILSDRAEYRTSKNATVMKVWGELVFKEQYLDYLNVMLNEMKSFTYPANTGGMPLSAPKVGTYGNHNYVYAYRNSTDFDKINDKAWFSSGKVFFPEKSMIVTITFYKPIGVNYEQAVANTRFVLQTLIDSAAS